MKCSSTTYTPYQLQNEVASDCDECRHYQGLGSEHTDLERCFSGAQLEKKILRCLGCVHENRLWVQKSKRVHPQSAMRCSKLLRFLKQVLFIICYALVQSCHLRMYTQTNGFLASSYLSPSFLLGIVGTFLLFENNMCQMPYVLQHFCSDLLNKIFPVAHRYLHCIDTLCAFGRCSGLLAFGSV